MLFLQLLLSLVSRLRPSARSLLICNQSAWHVRADVTAQKNSLLSLQRALHNLYSCTKFPYGSFFQLSSLQSFVEHK